MFKKFTIAFGLLIFFVSPVFGEITLNVLGTYTTGVFDEGAAETVGYDATTQRLFVSNADGKCIDVLGISIPEAPYLINSIDLSGYGKAPTCVAVKGSIVAASVKKKPVTDPGVVVFFDVDGTFLSSVTVGAAPDMITFTPDCSKVLVANEGEPDDDYEVDPEGSVSIIDLSNGVVGLTQENVSTADFTAFNEGIDGLRAQQIRIFGPGATVAQDLEPEYITVSGDSKTAWVALQENNAIAVIDIDTATVVDIFGLGFKNHKVLKNGIDASDKDDEIDDAINIRPWPVRGMYQPDGMASVQVGGETYIITANEGDARDYDGFSEEARVSDLILHNGLLASNPSIQEKENLGRLKITTEPPTGKVETKEGTVYRDIYSYGARSFSIWTPSGEKVYDSGNDFERITAELYPDNFNANNDDNKKDKRSDDKGPEPECVTVIELSSKIYALIGLERISGIIIYDVTDPTKPVYAGYADNRNFEGDPEGGTGGDLGPETILFIPASDSPNGSPLVVVANEVSGSTTIYAITDQ